MNVSFLFYARYNSLSPGERIVLCTTFMKTMLCSSDLLPSLSWHLPNPPSKTGCPFVQLWRLNQSKPAIKPEWSLHSPINPDPAKEEEVQENSLNFILAQLITLLIMVSPSLSLWLTVRKLLIWALQLLLMFLRHLSFTATYSEHCLLCLAVTSTSSQSTVRRTRVLPLNIHLKA